MKTKIEVEIENIKVQVGGYYSFDFKISFDGKVKQEGSYDSDFDSMSSAKMKKLLENGYAVQLALEQLDFE